MSAEMTGDPVDPRQRRHAVMLGVIVGGAFVAVMIGFIILFSINGLPKDPKAWKRLEERRAAAEAEKKAAITPPAASPTPTKDAPR